VIPNFIWRALHAEPLIVTGTGEETRDFIYVDDLVDGLVAGALTPSARGHAVNLGTGVQTRVIDLAEVIIKACHSRSRIEFAPRRAWDRSTHREADISKAKRLMGFSPRVNMREGIERTVDWFREHRETIAKAMEPRP
jgi:nucleoside-diphosphate-sugar epimerase